MVNLDELDEPKCYAFSWEVLGYDCSPSKLRSPSFRVNFQVTEWYMELDFSRLQSIDSCIPFRLQRVVGIGPKTVIFDIKVTVQLNENRDFKFKDGHNNQVFTEGKQNHWECDIDIPPQKLESKENEFNWLTAKTLLITLEIRSPVKTDPSFPKKFWYNDASLKAVVDSLKTLYSDGYAHDLVLDVSGKELKLHKCILNVRWPKLASILGATEPSERIETEQFPAIPYDILVHLLKFAYCGELDFMYQLHEIDTDFKVFSLVDEYNFYRLNDKIAQLSPKCSSSQMLQSYRSSFEMQFTNVTSTEKPMGDLKTCEIPLKPRIVPKPDKDYIGSKEHFEQHIRFMDLRVYVDKGPFGYNWLKFSVVLGKVPEKNPVTMKCKLYVVAEDKVKYLLTEQVLVFDKNDEVKFSTSFSKEKESKRYHKISEPVITWRELTDERNNFMRIRSTTDRKGQVIVKKDICFRFEVKLADGELLHDMRHGESVWSLDGDYKIFKDLELMYNEEKFTDITLTAGSIKVKAHKAILAARSTQLKKFFKANPNAEILETNMNSEHLLRFIHYLYTGQLLVPNDTKPFLDIAKEYELPCLTTVIEDHKEQVNGTKMICG